ncbi:MAG: LuxR C-terminal-related transcriptional regulator [Egibacteraceae bacterium]
MGRGPCATFATRCRRVAGRRDQGGRAPTGSPSRSPIARNVARSPARRSRVRCSSPGRPDEAVEVWPQAAQALATSTPTCGDRSKPESSAWRCTIRRAPTSPWPSTSATRCSSAGARPRRSRCAAPACLPRRASLASGVGQAQLCGATPPLERGHVELRASGARPTAGVVRPAALTSSERRVAELAAAGRSNHEIARALLITTTTVEAHLARTYRKLGIAGWTGLPTRSRRGRVVAPTLGGSMPYRL